MINSTATAKALAIVKPDADAASQGSTLSEKTQALVKTLKAITAIEADALLKLSDKVVSLMKSEIESPLKKANKRIVDINIKIAAAEKEIAAWQSERDQLNAAKATAGANLELIEDRLTRPTV